MQIAISLVGINILLLEGCGNFFAEQQMHEPQKNTNTILL